MSLDVTDLYYRHSTVYSKTCVKQALSKRPQIVFQDQLLLNAGLKYCRMLQGEHFAILSTFIKLPFVIKIFVSSIFEWRFYTGFTVTGKSELEDLDSILGERRLLWFGLVEHSSTAVRTVCDIHGNFLCKSEISKCELAKINLKALLLFHNYRYLAG